MQGEVCESIPTGFCIKFQPIFVVLKKAICILFFGVYLISATEFSQFLKFPMLIHHYAEHKGQIKDLTLWQYLVLHYQNDNVIDMDHSEDKQLPFKSHDCCSGSVLGTYVPATFFTLFTKTFYKEPITHFVSTEDFVNAVYLSSIWQPPRSC